MLYGHIPDERCFPVYDEIGEGAEEEYNAGEKDPEKFSTEASNENISLMKECKKTLLST
jgi:hypothetical protein